MVKIIKIESRQNDDGNEFNVLILQGGVEMVRSERTGNFYATTRKASVTSTFDDETAKALVGTEISGSIEKTECEPYEVINQESGLVTTLTHRYVYVPEESETKKNPNNSNELEEISPSTIGSEKFSENGILEDA